jgi:hypothetical protein
MALLDFLFDPQTHGGGLLAPRWAQSPQQAQAAFDMPTSHYQFGGQNVPVFGQSPGAPEVSSQSRLQTPQFNAPPMPQQAQPQQPVTMGDRMDAASDMAKSGAAMGPLGALFGGIAGFAGGQSNGNATVRALMARGVDRDTALAATKSPQLMQAVLQQVFANKTAVINNRLVRTADGAEIGNYSDPKTHTLGPDQRLVNDQGKLIVGPSQTAPKTHTLGPDQRLVNDQGKLIVGPSQTAKFDDVSSLRKEVGGLPEVKRFGEAITSFRSMVASHDKDSAAADLDYVYGVAKIFDPDSVVREGEMKLVGSAQSLPEDIKGYIKRVAMGEGRLTPEARLRILEVANTRMTELRSAYEQRAGVYGGISDRYNMRREDVMPQMPDMPKLPEMSQAPKAGDLPRPKTPAEASKLKPGQQFIDPNGVLRTR